MDSRRALILAFLSFFFQKTEAYSFKFDSNPSQCGDLSVSITGSGGSPPYRLSIVPWGGSPLQGGSLEVRKIIDLQFNDTSHLSFNFPYPKDSQFIAIVSDKDGADSNFASGGVTVPVTITESKSDSCLPTKQGSPPFVFGTNPVGSVTTCQQSLLNWDSSATQGDVKFWGAVPGGSGFIIHGDRTRDQERQAIAWTPPVSTGTGLIIVAGDNRGFGSGGSFQGFLQPGNGTTSCLNDESPKTTPGSPAGGSYPTDSSGNTTGGGGSNVGAIVGGVIGGVGGAALIGLLVFLVLRRRKSRAHGGHDPVDLLDGREENDNNENQPMPEQYIPEPYHIPPSAPTEMSESTGLRPLSSRERRHSQLSLTTQTRLSSDETSSVPGRSTVATSAKSPNGPGPLRAMNIIQHEDAGPSGGVQEDDAEEETVELPPAYTNLRK